MRCNLCENRCNADRSVSMGKCGVRSLRIAKYYLHPFEEPPVSFKKGSGTVFFCGCSLKCAFCQNYEVSRNERGKDITVSELADIFRELENMGAENINLVSPTQYIEEIIEAFHIYKPKIPVVYNTHSYESTEGLEKIAPYVDIFLPDLKYYDDTLAEKYSGARNYFAVATRNILRMRELKKDVFTADGKMTEGLIVRHLVLPSHTDDSLSVLKFLSEQMRGTLVSVMSQYVPLFDAKRFKEIDRKLFSAEIARVEHFAEEAGICGFFQEKSAAATDFIPKWDF